MKKHLINTSWFNFNIMSSADDLPLMLIALISGLVLSIFHQYIFIGILTIIILYCLYFLLSRYKFNQINFKDLIVYLIIISLLIAISDIGEILRYFIMIISGGLLFYLFLKEYGLKISAFPKLPARIFNYIILVIVSMLLSSLFSENIMLGFSLTIRQFIFFIFVYLLFTFITTEKIFIGFINSIIISGVILSISIIINFFTSDTLMYILATRGLVTNAGYFNNQAGAGGLLAVSIPLTLGILFVNNEKTKNLKHLYFSFFLLEFISILFTNSRAAIGSSFLSLLIMIFILNKKLFKKILTVSIVLVLSVILLFPNLFEVFLTFFRSERVLENTRYYLWDMGIGMFKDNPIFGVGPGLFQHYMYNYMPLMFGSWEELGIRSLNATAGANHVGISHNFLIARASELGIIGLLTAFLIPVIFYNNSKNILKEMKSNFINDYPLIVAIYSIGIGLIFRSFFEVTGFLSYGWFSRDLPFWLVFIILTFYSDKKIKNYHSTVSLKKN